VHSLVRFADVALGGRRRRRSLITYARSVSRERHGREPLAEVNTEEVGHIQSTVELRSRRHVGSDLNDNLLALQKVGSFKPVSSLASLPGTA
jgi:hypothetical protein